MGISNYSTVLAIHCITTKQFRGYAPQEGLWVQDQNPTPIIYHIFSIDSAFNRLLLYSLKITLKYMYYTANFNSLSFLNY